MFYIFGKCISYCLVFFFFFLLVSLYADLTSNTDILTPFINATHLGFTANGVWTDFVDCVSLFFKKENNNFLPPPIF